MTQITPGCDLVTRRSPAVISAQSVPPGRYRYNQAMWFRKAARFLNHRLAIFPLILATLLSPSQGTAQQGPPAAVPGSAGPPPANPSFNLPAHPFWDRENLLLFSGVAVFRGLDYASTRNMQARGREEILLPDDVVNNSGGFAALEAAGTAASVGLSYWMHRTGHHKLERWVSVVHIGVAGFGDARNYALKSKHPVAP